MKTSIFLTALAITSNFFGQIAGSGMTDIDGNVYNSVIIGTQEWVSENLNVSKYNDGTIIPQVTDPTAWSNLTTGAWCYYDNDPANGSIYGKLYNYYAVAGIHDNDPNTPNKFLAPAGWHVPTDVEWTTLSTFVGGSTVSNIGVISSVGGLFKSTGTSLWQIPNTSATNSTGFTGLPGGMRGANNFSFYTINLHGFWWSSTPINNNEVWNRGLSYDNNDVWRTYWFCTKPEGYSVRLLNDTLFSDSPTNIETIEGKTMNIYPNPATDYVVFDLGNFTTSGNWNYTIKNTIGQEIKKGEISSQQTMIYLNDIKGKGLFLVHIYDALDQLVFVKKVQLK